MSTEQEPSDAELISAVRGGDTAAYGDLFARHVEAARRLARQLTSAGDVEDLVSEAFAKVLTIVQRGGGPDLAFRAYLLTAVRSLHIDSVRGATRLRPVDDFTPFDTGVPFRDTAVEGFENQAAARAFATLPERWQLVLWHTEVEGQKPADVAQLLGMSANSVSALAYRAREGLRQAFLNMHAQDAEDDACAWTQDNLGAYIRNAASKRDSAKVRAHIDECRRCMGIYLELSEVNTNLSGVLGPLVLGSAAAGYIAAAVGGAAAQGGGLLGFISAHSAATAVTGVAAAIVVIMGVIFGLNNSPDGAPITADPGLTTAPPTSAPPTPTDSTPTSRPSETTAPTNDGPGRTPDDQSPGAPITNAPESEDTQATDSPSSPGIDQPDPDPTLEPPSPPNTQEPTPEVDAAVRADSSTQAQTVSTISLSITGLGDQGGVLEITSSDNDGVQMGGDCPGSGTARECTIAPGATSMTFQVNTGEIDGTTMIFFNIRPLGDVVDTDDSNNHDSVELEPATP